jgi:acyl-CoA reductase-like NAD-dependent aldehyde dehydrogenase
MSAVELVAEKVKRLPEYQAQAVLAFIRELSDSPGLSAGELMRLPPAERRRILRSQARQAEALYRDNADMIVEDTEAPLDYEHGVSR